MDETESGGVQEVVGWNANKEGRLASRLIGCARMRENRGRMDERDGGYG